MTTRSSKLIAAPLLVLVLSGLTVVDPCDGKHSPFEIEDIRNADVIFGGMLIRYEIIQPKSRLATERYGLLTVKITDRIKGNMPEVVTIQWQNSPRGAPMSLARREPILVAAVGTKLQGKAVPGMPASLHLSQSWSVMQRRCSSPFILHYSVTNAANIRSILKGNAVQPRNYFQTGEMEREQGAKVAAEEAMLRDMRRIREETAASERTKARRDQWIRAALALAGLGLLVWLAIQPLKRR